MCNYQQKNKDMLFDTMLENRFAKGNFDSYI